MSHLPSPDSQNEPSNLVRKREIKAKLLNSEPVEDVLVTNPDETPIEPAPTASPTHIYDNPIPVHKNPLELLSDAIGHIDSNELVEVFGPFGRITFRAVHVSANDYGLAFIVNKDHMTYEPKINTNLRIKCKGEEYAVVYAGGYFTFRQMPFTFLSFIKITEENE